MTLSRRGFLEVGALSASGIVLKDFVPAIEAFGETPQSASAHIDRKLPRALEARVVLSMNQDWQFWRPREADAAAGSGLVSANENALLSEAKWEPATLPHSARLEPRDVSGGRNFQGICWYRRTFAAQSEWKGRVVYLKFQAAMQVADVWLNGVHLTTHYGGYTPFTLDISQAMSFDRDNVLAVRLDNSDNPEVPPGKPQKDLDFCYFGGIYRGVDLEVMHPLHITDPILADKIASGGIFITFPVVNNDESTVEVQTDIANESDERKVCVIEQKLIGPNGQLVATATDNAIFEARSSHALTQSLRVRQPRLWHPNDPQLYWLHTRLLESGKVLDDSSTRIGIRSIRFEKERGLLINGQPFFSVGANRHQDHPYVGYALPPSAHYRDAFKLRDAGFTSYRSHYPQDPSFMDACDELGILAIVSNPGWQFVGDDVFKKRVYRNARDMIRRDRNRPSVAIWEAALNESDNSSIAIELFRIVHEEFPGPGVYAAGDTMRQSVPGFDGWDIVYMWDHDNDPVKPSWIREWGDQVDNWSDQQARVRVDRLWGETPMLVQAYAHMHRMNRLFQPGMMPAGATLWAGIDASRAYHHQPFLGSPLDVFRLPKFDYFMFQSQRPAEGQLALAGSGPMLFIAGFATLYSPSTVTVYSNCEQVRLKQNGKTLATQAPDSGYQLPHPPYTFKVGEFSSSRSILFANNVAPPGTEIGELIAEGLIDGKVVATHRIQSPGEPKSLELRLDTCGLAPVADGGDWVRAYAHVCDARGTTYPFSNDMVTFSVSGEGSLIGDETIFANPVRAEAGIATALVRTTKTPGQVSLHASSPGLREAVLQFETIKSGRGTLL